jgi:hypothetical protein
MVLKVLRGKILETLELSLRPTARSPVLELRVRIEAGAVVRLSKNLNYLIDNYYRMMLSATKGGVKKKAVGLGLRFLIWELAVAVPARRGPVPDQCRRGSGADWVIQRVKGRNL